MAEPASLLDPFALWRDLRSQLEKGVAELASQGVNSDEFSAGMHKALGASLATRQVTRELMQRYLEALNVPTRADFQALGERLQAIEDSLLGMSAALDRLGGAEPAGNARPILGGPPRTKKPPLQALLQEPAPVALAAAPVTVPKRRKTPVPVPRRKKSAA